MTQQSIPLSSPLGAAFAAALPPFDPLAPHPKRVAGRRLVALSVLLHLILFLLFGSMLFGAALEEEEAVIVRMIEPEKPVPEPPKRRRKVLAQRRIDTSVTRFKEIAQPEVSLVKPVPVLDQTRKAEVDPTELTEAPKVIERREIVTQSVSVFSEVQTQVQPIEVDRVNPEVRRVRAGQASAGPRKLEAGGPRTTPHAVDVEAPVIAEGQLSRNAIQGTIDGARIASLESGVSERMLAGRGERGSLTGAAKDCDSDGAFTRYLSLIEGRVYSRWHVPADVHSGKVQLAFRIDRGGSAHSITVRSAADPELGRTCLAAFRHASPFPPPPKELHHCISKTIIATFSTSEK